MAIEYRVRRITNRDQYREAVAFLESLTGEESEAVLEDAQLVADLVSAYEAAEFPTRPSSPGQMLRFLMESNDLTQSALKEQVGISQSTLSEILTDKRAPTAAQAARLGERFSVVSSLFMDKESAQVFNTLVERRMRDLADELTNRVADEVVRRLNRA
jgi:HTH-type transcriptional regulator/antitoxin HigA